MEKKMNLDDPKIVAARQKKVKSLKAQMDATRTWSDRLADRINTSFGSMAFFGCHVFFFALWIAVNSGVLPMVPAFDPYPFGFLTMVVSLEAIFLSIFVLISQNRAAKVADVREEVDLQINVKAEQEITRLLNMLDEVHDKLGLIEKDDKQLRSMKKKTNLKKLEDEILQEIENEI